MDTSDFTPAEMRIVRTGEIAGWTLAALMLAGVLATFWVAQHQVKAKVASNAANRQAYLAAISACQRAGPTFRKWDECESIVDERFWEGGPSKSAP